MTFLLIGCTAIESSRYSGKPADGMAYYLPKGRIKITLIQQVIPASNPVVAPRRLGSLVLSNSLSYSETGSMPGKPPATNDDGSIIFNVVSNTLVTNQVTEFRAVTNDLSSGAVQTNAPQTNVYISVDADLIPDRSEPYVLKLKPSGMADDYIRIGVSNSLLEAVSLTNSDQTLSVISNLALAAVEAVKAHAVDAAPTAVLTTNVFYLVGPFNADICSNLSNNIATNFQVSFDFTDIGKAVLARNASNEAQSVSGIFYRPLQAYQIAWQGKSSGAGAATVYLPDASPVLNLTMERASFVSQSYSLTIRQGVPFEIVLNKPSQLSAASTLPLAIARSVASLPTNILQLKFDIATMNNKVLAEQNAAISNQINLLVTAGQLAAARQSNSAAAQPAGGTRP